MGWLEDQAAHEAGFSGAAEQDAQPADEIEAVEEVEVIEEIEDDGGDVE